MADRVVESSVRVTVPAKRVWAALTEPSALEQWYAPGCPWEIGAVEPGARVRFYNTPTEVQTAVIESCVAPEVLVLRWTPDPSRPEISLLNTYRIEESTGGCVVTVSQTGYASVPEKERLSWIRADEKAFPAIANALAAYLMKEDAPAGATRERR